MNVVEKWEQEEQKNSSNYAGRLIINLSLRMLLLLCVFWCFIFYLAASLLSFAFDFPLSVTFGFVAFLFPVKHALLFLCCPQFPFKCDRENDLWVSFFKFFVLLLYYVRAVLQFYADLLFPCFVFVVFSGGLFDQGSWFPDFTHL